MTITTQTLPTEYNPTEVDHFIGPAKITAGRIVKCATMCKPLNAAVALLFVGPSGSGKTTLAKFAMAQFLECKWNLSEYFGSDLSVEVVREISTSMRLTSMYPGYRGFLLDEIDRCTKDARDRLLEVVGEQRQAKGTIIVATSNLSVEEFDQQEKSRDARGRLSSRFQVHQVNSPTAAQLIPLISQWLPEEQAKTIATQLGTGPTGKQEGINVRSAMKDVLTVMQA